MIRKANAGDLNCLAELFRQLHQHHVDLTPENYTMPFPQYFSLEMQSFLDDEKMTVVLYEHEKTVAAYAVFHISRHSAATKPQQTVLFIEQFAVREDNRRQGVGSELFSRIKEYAEQNGCNSVQLGANAQNTSALSFYESMGMKPRTIKMELKLN